MKRTIIAAFLLTLIVASGFIFKDSSTNTVQMPIPGITVTSAPNSNGSYCGPQSGTFTTDGSGVGFIGAGVSGTYTICVSGKGGGVITVNYTYPDHIYVTVNNGASCPCGN